METHWRVAGAIAAIMPGMSESKRSAVATATAIEETRSFAIEAARLATEFRCEDVAVIDLRGLSSVADYFVLGTGTSDRQMHAVLGHLEELAKRQGRRPYNVSNPREASWILVDYVDVMVHLFDASHRTYYDLDGLWGDAPRVEWKKGA